ncbi:MAG TPA: bifunctional methylenetetrahydrofolate dehydrogenase/methenyltetrahydrofolate cyclohydrolase FolD [Bacteroidota bacterium]|nr:bifunctional methylenetetrahydrofolate dehydrogenase/methenyltetrahydrofolate cyclohydrolase FolD [Bacteroidota bacterium]
MPAQIIDGRRIAEEIRREVKAEVERLRLRKGIQPGLSFILVGDNPASESYVRSKEKACHEVGFYSVTERLDKGTSEEKLLDKIEASNRDSRIHGILVQLPLPQHMSEKRVLETISPEKDVDGFHPLNVGRLMIGEEGFRPCTPAGIQELLIRSGNDPAGKHVVVVGRSNIVGKPIANMLMQKVTGANAIVTVAHTGARDLSRYTLQAEILIAAIGKAEAITGDMVKEGVVVIDVGINRVEDPSSPNGYRIVGDVHFDSVSKKAKAITPVPGGVGPMTIAMLLKNTLHAAKKAVS